MQSHNFFSLEQAIDRHPLIVTTDTPLEEVIRQMQAWGNSCSFNGGEVGETVGINNSCVLVVENSQLQGIFTERDLVKLVANETNTENVTVREVMTRKVVTLTITNSHDVFTALKILFEHRIRHLPVVDNDNNLLGLITAKNLRQIMQPINLMKWRTVSEVMETEVIHAAPDVSIQHIAKLMANNFVSCVAIAELEINPETHNSFVYPQGIITERDIVQFQNLNLAFDQPARNLMSAPLFLVSPEDSLWSAHQQMQQRRVRRLLVGGKRGELQGIVTQTSILQLFDPTEMYGLVESLQQQVCQLEIEKNQALEKRARELEQQVTDHTAELRQAHQQLFFHLNNTPLAVVEWDNDFCVKHWSERAEQIFGWSQSEVMGKHWRDWQFVLEEDIDDVTRIISRLLDGIEPGNISHNRNYAKNGSVVDCEWYHSVLLDEAGNLISILSLAQDVSEREQAYRDRQIAQQALTEREQRFNSILSTIEDAIWSVAPQSFATLYINKAAERIYGRPVAEFYDNSDLWLEVVHPEDRERVRDRTRNILKLESYEIEYRIIRPDDTVRWLNDRIRVIHNPQGQPIRIDGITRDISDRIEAEAALRESEQRFRNLADQAPMMVWVTDENAYCTYVSQSWCEFTGQTKETGLGFGWLDAIHPEDRPAAQTIFLRANERQEAFQLDYRVRRHDGEYRWAIDAAKPWIGNDDQFKGYIGSVIDISDRKQAELEILKFVSLADNSSEFIGMCDLNFVPFYLNKAGKQLVGLDNLEQYSEVLVEDFFFPEDRDFIFNEFFPQVLREGQAEVEIRFRHFQTGEAIWMIYNVHSIEDDNGRSIALATQSRDISDRKRREEILKDIASGVSVETGVNFLPSLCQYLCKTLKVDNAMVGELIQSQVDSIQTLAVRGKGQVIENFTYPITGTPCEEVVRQGLCIYPEAIQELFPHDPMLQSMAAESYAGISILKSDGTVLGLIAVLDTKPFADVALIEEVLKIFANRITSELERQQAENKIRQQAALLNLTHDTIIVRNLDNMITFWNRGAEVMYGWTKREALGQNSHQLLQARFNQPLAEIETDLSQTGHWEGEIIHHKKDGTEVIVMGRWSLLTDGAINPTQILEINHDITQQKQLETQFLRAQRLESLGTLAGGIAHDLNNILSPILGFSRLLPLKLPNLDEQTKSFFRIMENNAQRGTTLVKQILTFSRGMEGEKGIVQIRHLIDEIGQIIRETFPKTIELELDVPKNLWTVNGDLNQLHQVLMNLAVNARDAMPHGGRMQIAAENFPINTNFAKQYLDAQVGPYILITVSDTGVGIAPEIIDHIFEPFFTTKEIGRGTGLGLSTVIGIIKSHGGFVDVVSDSRHDSRGTQFKVFLPACELEAIAAEETEAIPEGNGELILVVDDETSILEVTQAILETYNYRVLTATNGIEAIATYAHNLNAIELVIADIMMPFMDGKTAIRTLKQIDPEVKIIAVSGLISSQEIISELDNLITAFIPKPYSNEELLRTIDEIIN